MVSFQKHWKQWCSKHQRLGMYSGINSYQKLCVDIHSSTPCMWMCTCVHVCAHTCTASRTAPSCPLTTLAQTRVALTSSMYITLYSHFIHNVLFCFPHLDQILPHYVKSDPDTSITAGFLSQLSVQAMKPLRLPASLGSVWP